jgi:hypothetical protein
MAKKYYSKNSSSNNKFNEKVDIPLYSYGLAVPRTGMQACLCADKLTYSRKCCKGFLINQGIGNIYGGGAVDLLGDFNLDFSNDFFI